MGSVQKWLWDVHSLTCQEATRLAAGAMDQPLTIGERVGLFLHSVLCGNYRNYARRLRLVRKWAWRVSAPNASVGPGILNLPHQKEARKQISRAE